jgi:hypothetical protein
MTSTADAPETDGDRPNVLVVICDDLGYGDLACHGNTVVETPEIGAPHGESTRPTPGNGCGALAATPGHHDRTTAGSHRPTTRRR